MALKKYICEFEVCESEFVADRKNARFCSEACKRSAQILEWAPKLIEMKQEGKTGREMGRELGISKNAALTRAIRLNSYRERYPELDLILSMRISYGGNSDK